MKKVNSKQVYYVLNRAIYQVDLISFPAHYSVLLVDIMLCHDVTDHLKFVRVVYLFSDLLLWKEKEYIVYIIMN